MKKLPLLIGFFMITFSSKCQSDFVPGFIISLQGDTIRGFLNSKTISASARNCSFKKSLDDKFTEYSPKDINGFKFENGRFYISSHTMDYKKDIFLEFLFKGKVDLFYYRNDGEDFYLAKKNSTVMDLDHTTDTIRTDNGNYYRKSTRYIGQLKVLMVDDPALNNRIEGTSYTSKNLVSLMKGYHDQTCKPDEPCIEYYKKDTRLLKVNYGIFICAGSPNLLIDERLTNTYYPEMQKWDFKGPSKSFSVGFLITIGMDALIRNLSIVGEPSYSIYRFKSDEQLNYSYPPSSSVRNRMSLNINAIKLPLSLQYTFKKAAWKIHPFLQAGGWYSNFVSTSSELKYNLILDNVPSEGSYQFDFGSYQTGYLLSFGSDFPLKTHKLRIALKYEKGTGIHAGADNPSKAYKNLTNTKGFSLQLGYIF